MKLIEHLEKSCLIGITGYINDKDDIDNLRKIISYNLSVLNSLTNKKIKIILNYNQNNMSFSDISLYTDIVNMAFGCTLDFTILSENRGHTFGSIDLDNFLFRKAKESDAVLLKISMDTIFNSEYFLNLDIEPADFYYLNGIGYGGMAKYNFDIDKIIKEDFYPQTNFYIINTQCIDSIADKDVVENAYNLIKEKGGDLNRPWETIPYFSCEDLLKEKIIKANLKTFNLLNLESYKNLLKFIEEKNIHDPSHKNIMVAGVCHFHNMNEQISYFG